MLDLTAAFATFPTLTTERCILRAVTAEDADDIFRIMSNPEVTRYFGRLPMTSPDEAVARVQRLHKVFQEQSGIRWAIASRASGRLIGTCGFWRIMTEHFRAEIGYELDQAMWGQGLMAEAVDAMLGFGFTDMGLHSVEANIHPDNTGSRRVLEKLGFVQEGYFRENYYDPVAGVFTDSAVLGLLKADWLSRRAAHARGRR